MSKYVLYGSALNLFDAFAGPADDPNLEPPARSFPDSGLYLTPTEIGIRNADGSYLYLTGTGFSYDPVLGIAEGTVTGVVHTSGGKFIDEITGLSVPLFNLGNDFTSAGLANVFLSGDDLLDARNRVGGAVLPATLKGFAGNDIIYGGAGNDLIKGGAGADRVFAGAGNDHAIGGNDSDTLRGQAGNDRLVGDGGREGLEGDGAYSGTRDILYGDEGNDVLFGVWGNDSISGGAGTDTAVFASSFADLKITKTATGFRVTSAEGTDTLTGIERIAADEGSFTFNTATNSWSKVASAAGVGLINPSQVIRGTTDADLLEWSTVTNAVVYGLGGDDVIGGGIPQDGPSLIWAGSGNDTVRFYTGRAYGESGDDVMSGGGMLDGGAGNDTLSGAAVMRGGSGNDNITGGVSHDTMTGGTGADTFIFDYSNGFGFPGVPRVSPWGKDVITDFQVGVDKLDFNYDLTGGAPAPVESLTLTVQGYVITTNLDAFMSDFAGSTIGPSQILLKGVSTPGLTLDDLIA